MARRDTRKEYLIWRYVNNYEIQNFSPISEIDNGFYKNSNLLEGITIADLKAYLLKFIGMTPGEPGEVEKKIRAAIYKLEHPEEIK